MPRRRAKAICLQRLWSFWYILQPETAAYLDREAILHAVQEKVQDAYMLYAATSMISLQLLSRMTSKQAQSKEVQSISAVYVLLKSPHSSCCCISSLHSATLALRPATLAHQPACKALQPAPSKIPAAILRFLGPLSRSCPCFRIPCLPCSRSGLWALMRPLRLAALRRQPLPTSIGCCARAVPRRSWPDVGLRALPSTWQWRLGTGGVACYKAHIKHSTLMELDTLVSCVQRHPYSTCSSRAADGARDRTMNMRSNLAAL